MTPFENTDPKTGDSSSVLQNGIERHEKRAAHFAQGFAQVVSVLMRDPMFKNMALGELQWLLLPPLLSGQWRVAFVNAPGAADASRGVPSAVALWARVSPNVDLRLARDLQTPVRLGASEWTSGQIPWLIATAGDRKVVPQLLKTLDEREFNGQDVRLRKRGANGATEVGRLSDYWKELMTAPVH